MRSGVCAIVGRPNVGKSTLLNAMVGEKVAITTPVPQTTRRSIRGVLTRDDAQILFVDTPGLHKPRKLLGERLNAVARAALEGVDVVLFVVDGASGVGRGDEHVAALLRPLDVPVIAVLNQVDRMSKAAQLPALAALAELGDFEEVVPISALRGDQVDLLVDLLVARLPEGPLLVDPGDVTDQTLEDRVAELIRAHAIVATREEVPHSIAVVVEEMVPGTAEGVTAVHASLYVERDSQKGIVIGRRGAMLAAIGRQARPEIEELLGTKVYLDLRVKLAKEWQRDPKKLQRLGF